MTTIRILKLDETRHWRDDIRAVARTIFGVYLYDPGLRVHCCELTPSHELHYMGSVISGSPAYDALDEEAREAFYTTLMEGSNESESHSYMHVWRVRGLPELTRADALGIGHASLGDFDGDTDDEAMEAATEYVRGNGYTDT